MEHKKWKYPTRLPASIPTSPRRGKSFIQELQTGDPDELSLFASTLRPLLDIEGIAPSTLTPDLAVELGRRLPTTPKSQIKVPNLAKLFVAHLIESI
jgi:hypothetical protein